MTIYTNLDTGKLHVGDANFSVSCNVRSIRDGTRQSYEVIKTTSINPEYKDKPYDPLPFPKGTWNITGLVWQIDKHFDANTYGPVKILTDAWQWVNVWELDEYGDYLRESALKVKDECYWIHYSKSITTLGCIRAASEKDILTIAGFIQNAYSRGEKVFIEVS